MKKIVWAFALLLPAAAFAYEPRILDKTPRSMGMGGVGVSTYGYTFSPMANPAALGLMSDYTMVPMMDLGFSLNEKTVGLLREVTEVAQGQKHFTNVNFDNYIGKMATIGFNSPLSLGFMGKGFGIWMNTGAEGGISVFHEPNSPIRGIKVATVFDTVDKVSNIVTAGGGNITAGNVANVEQVLKDGIYKDLLNSGLSQAEVYAQANQLITEITGAAAGTTFVNPDGTVNQANLDTAWQNIQTGGNLNIPEATLRKLIPKLNLRLYADIAVNVGYGYKVPFRAMDDVSGISFGATVRFLQRFKSDSYSNLDPSTIDGSKLTGSIWQAFTITSDFGMSLRLQNFILAFAARDAFSAPFQWRGVTDGIAHTATKFLPSLDVGASYRFLFKNPWVQEFGMYFEAIDMMNTEISAARKIRLGLELKLFRFLDLRLGMYDAFVTGGLGMGGKWGRIDFAYYRQTYQIYKGYNVHGDQYTLNLSLALENTPERKAAALAKKRERDRIMRERQAARDIQAIPVEPAEPADVIQ